MRNKALAVIIVGMLGSLALAQPAPMGPGGMPGMVRPVPPERLVTALAQEMEWLEGLSIDAPGWDQALGALEGVLAELEGIEGAPPPEAVVRLNSALHLVIDILERTTFQHARARGEEARQGPPEWLEEYLDEATAGMGAEDAARVRAIVYGLARGVEAQVGKAVRERVHQGRVPKGPGRGERVREAMPAELEAWIQGYLAGATAGMSQEEAAQVREICRGAIRAGWEFRQELKETRQENLRHLLHLRGISAGLDIMILKATGE